MAKVIWSELALDDLKNIYEYISNDSIYYAGRQIERIIERVEQLQNFPESGRIVPEFNKEILRELIEGNYRIVLQNRIEGPNWNCTCASFCQASYHR